jgi:hypothetical protein
MFTEKVDLFSTEGVTLSGAFSKDRERTAFWRNSYFLSTEGARAIA